MLLIFDYLWERIPIFAGRVAIGVQTIFGPLNWQRKVLQKKYKYERY